MYEYVEKSKENKSKAVANSVAQNKSDVKQAFGFVDNRPKVVTQKKTQSQMNDFVVQRVLQIGNDRVPLDQLDVLTNDAYSYGEKEMHLLPQDLVKVNLKNTLRDWLLSNPHELPGGLKLGSIRPSLGMEDNQPKAHWKRFPDRDSFFKQLIYDSHPQMLKNRNTEITLATRVLGNVNIANDLNELRRALGRHLWQQNGLPGKMSYYVTTSPVLNPLPSMGGSYNLANSYPSKKDHKMWGGMYNPLNWGISVIDYVFGSRDRMSLLFDERNFTVSENVAILHDIKELFSPKGNSRALPTAHSQLIPHPYQGEKSPDKPQRWEINEDYENKRVDVLKKDLQPYQGDPHENTREIKWDQGRLGAGTRNESSPDTKTARKGRMPIETGRSHTAARLFEMVSLLKPDANASEEEKKLFADRIKAMAYGIFGYWNAKPEDGGYSKSLTPVHTYHEVMDPAEDYLKGTYSQPFTYEDLKDYLKEKNG